MLRYFAIFAVLGITSGTRADQLVLFAGGGLETEKVPATKAKLDKPFGIDFDKDDNAYIVEISGRVLKVDRGGTLTIVAGALKNGDEGDGGPAAKALFNGPHSLAIPPGGVDVFVADTWNGRVRKIDGKTGLISTFAGQPYLAGTKKYEYGGDGGHATRAKFSGVYCVAFTPKGDKLYIVDLENRRVRELDMKTGHVDRFAGHGLSGVPRDEATAKESPLVDPRACAVDAKGNVYILERSGHALRVVGQRGEIRTVAGTGKAGLSGDGGDALKATLNGPKHLVVDRNGDVIIADSGNHVVRRYNPSSGIISRVAGSGKKGVSGDGGDALTTNLNEPHGVFVHPSGTLYIVDSNNDRVFRLMK